MLEFFVATKSGSVYHVKEQEENGYPSATKIALRDGKSGVGVGESLNGGTMIGIGKTLVVFVPEESGLISPMSTIERDHNLVNTGWWGGETTEIVALFTEREAALECIKAGDLRPCDPRWIESTKKTLEKIGGENPTISISHCTGFSLV